ncbi:hypothetical protein ACQKM9_20135 [Viridibacillus sp. NPDC093762]|uniref:hypothetical protein n=1 Tax=Viridibacillus sp. NPDC093762 TaxID=3390720 RepID=UPI003D05E275
MKKRFMIFASLLSLVFASISSISAFAATGEPIEKEKFAIAEKSPVIEPTFAPALAVIANGARVAAAGVKVAKWGAAAFGAGFVGAAGADAYSKVSGKSLNKEELPANAELAFD